MSLPTDKGFVILTSTIVLGTVLLLITLSAGLAFFFLRKGTFDTTMKQRSFFLARTCTEQALLNLAIDSGYGGNETIVVDGTDECGIQLIQSTPPNTVITTTATKDDKTTTLVLTVDSNLTTVSLEEQ